MKIESACNFMLTVQNVGATRYDQVKKTFLTSGALLRHEVCGVDAAGVVVPYHEEVE